MGNPFLDELPELVTLDSCNCVDASVALSLHSLKNTGIRQYQDHVVKVLERHTVSIHEPIQKILLHFSRDLTLRQHLNRERS